MFPKVSKKNIGSFNAFSKDWFRNHQRGLLWLANTPIIRLWFRYVLRINGKRSSVGKRKILQVAPNFITWREDETHFTKEFRTHNKFAKRVYFAFKPLWWMLHFWDWLIADRFLPRLSFGFLTLTSFPDPNPETSTVDGNTSHNTGGSAWSVFTGGAGTNASPSNARMDIGWSEGAAANTWEALNRDIFLFDTSSLTSSATISSAVLSKFYFAQTNLGFLSIDINIYSSNPASNTDLVGADYATLGSTALSTAKTFSDVSGSGYKDYTLNATGIAAIDKTGISKFGSRNVEYDVGNTAPTWFDLGSLTGFNQLVAGFRTADQAGTTNDPKLVVTYTLAAADGNFLIMF